MGSCRSTDLSPPVAALGHRLPAAASCGRTAACGFRWSDSAGWRIPAQRTAVDLREPVSVHFSNIKSGYRVRTPFWVEFGIRGMGVIPAGNANEKAGHHHILIDTPLPRDHTAPIPFSATPTSISARPRPVPRSTCLRAGTRCGCCSPTTPTSPISSSATRSPSRWSGKRSQQSGPQGHCG